MRLYTLVVSIAAHAFLVVVLVIVPLYAMDALPGARQVTAFIPTVAAELPEPPPPPSSGRREPSTETARDIAPSHAPDRIAPETTPPPVAPGVPLNEDYGTSNVVSGDVPVLGVAPPPPPPVTEPIRPGGKIRPPKKIVDVAPVYPEIARRAQVEGVVILEAIIGENGRVRDVRVLRSNPLLDAAAIDAVRQWQFTPTLLNGQPVSVIMTVTVAFKLN